MQAVARGTTTMGRGELVVWRLRGESVVVAVFHGLGMWGGFRGSVKGASFPSSRLADTLQCPS